MEIQHIDVQSNQEMPQAAVIDHSNIQVQSIQDNIQEPLELSDIENEEDQQEEPIIYIDANDMISQVQVLEVDIRTHIAKLETQLKRSYWIFAFMIMICLVELAFIPVQVKKHWGRNKCTNSYLVGVSAQFLYHCYFLFTLTLNTKKLLDQCYFLECPQSLQLFMTYQILEEREIKLWKVFCHLIHKTLKLATINKILYFWMFLLGNIEFISERNTIDRWYLIQILAPGWICAAIGSITFFSFCIILPILACIHYYDQRMAQRRREDIIRRTLPTATQYEKLQKKGDQPCYICLQEFENEELVVQLTCSITHIFHKDCLKPWIETKTFCPVCRQDIK